MIQLRVIYICSARIKSFCPAVIHFSFVFIIRFAAP